MSRTKRSVLHVGANGLSTLITIGVGIVFTPWLLRVLGAERYGGVRALTDLFGYLALFDLGLGGAISSHLAIATGGGSEEAVRRVLAAGVRLYARVMLAMIASGAILIWLAPSLIASPKLSPSEVRLAALFSASVVVIVPLSVFRSAIEAQQRGYLVSVILIVQSLCTTVLILLAARAGWGLPGQTGVTAGVQIVAALLFVTFAGFHLRKVLMTPADPEIGASVWKLNWPTFLFNLCSRMALLSDNLVISWWMGPAAVAPFFLTQRVATIAQGQLQGIGNASWAGLVELHVQGKKALFSERLIELTTLVSGLGLAVLIPIAAFNPFLIGRWVGSTGYAGQVVNLLCCCNIWFWAIFSLWGWPISGIGAVGRFVPGMLAFVVINLGISLAATAWFGYAGPLIGTLTGFLAVHTWVLPKLLSDLFGVRAVDLWSAALRQLLWGIPLAAVLLTWVNLHTPPSWFALGSEAAVAGVAGLALLWRFGLTETSRHIWYARWGGLWRRDNRAAVATING